VASTPESPELKVPLLGTRFGLPGRGSLAWYVGVGAMTALEVIDWPVAVILATSHAIANHARDPAVRALGQGTATAA
jgi:hypothetical protein